MKVPYSTIFHEPIDLRSRAIIRDYQETLGPIPPVHQIMGSRFYWLSYVDYDGRIWPPITAQWQPHAKQWCHIGNYAQGEVLNLVGYVVIGELDQPDMSKVSVEQDDVSTQVFVEGV